MPYTTNNKMPRIRRDAARLYWRGWSARKIGRHLGYHHTAIMKWVKASRKVGDVPIRTKSSRPKHHPKQIDEKLVDHICKLRMETRRCSEVIHVMLKNEGIKVSLNTVRRTIDRHGLMRKRSHLKRWHPPVERPVPLKPGDLVQMDTIHLMISEKKRIYVFTLIDVYSRWAYAKCFAKMNAATSIRFIEEAQKKAVFHFQMLQSDHGPEFGNWFVSMIKKKHRYTRIGKPNDNAHIERFNRTIQEECLDKVYRDVAKINRALRKYMPYYNTQRLHLGINLQTPIEWCQGIG